MNTRQICEHDRVQGHGPPWPDPPWHDARRFGDEAGGYSGFAREVIVEGGDAFAIFDQRIRAAAAPEEEFNELVRMGGIKSAASVAGLAAIHDLDGAALAATIDAYNAAAAGETEDSLGRRAFGFAPLAPPFQICRVQPGLFHTQGGLKVDDGARVLRQGGAVTANLFAGGGVAAGISGRSGGCGYASGAGLLSALGLGRLSGLTAAAEIGAGI